MASLLHVFILNILKVYVFIAILFSVSGDGVQISGPDTAQIGSEVTLSCSSQESNPPSIIKWTVDGVEQYATQHEVTITTWSTNIRDVKEV